MAVADRHGLPVAICVESATPHEVKLATSTLAQMTIPEAPQNLIGDNAYDSDKLDTELRSYGIELISPHRSNRKNRTQDLRRMRRYRRRWKIERLFAWLQNFRRLVVRYERYAENFLGMLHLGCCLIGPLTTREAPDTAHLSYQAHHVTATGTYVDLVFVLIGTRGLQRTPTEAASTSSRVLYLLRNQNNEGPLMGVLVVWFVATRLRLGECVVGAPAMNDSWLKSLALEMLASRAHEANAAVL